MLWRVFHEKQGCLQRAVLGILPFAFQKQSNMFSIDGVLPRNILSLLLEILEYAFQELLLILSWNILNFSPGCQEHACNCLLSRSFCVQSFSRIFLVPLQAFFQIQNLQIIFKTFKSIITVSGISYFLGFWDSLVLFRDFLVIWGDFPSNS